MHGPIAKDWVEKELIGRYPREKFTPVIIGDWEKAISDVSWEIATDALKACWSVSKSLPAMANFRLEIKKLVRRDNPETVFDKPAVVVMCVGGGRYPAGCYTHPGDISQADKIAVLFCKKYGGKWAVLAVDGWADLDRKVYSYRHNIPCDSDNILLGQLPKNKQWDAVESLLGV